MSLDDIINGHKRRIERLLKKIITLDDQLEIRIKPRIRRMESAVAAMQEHYPVKKKMHPPLQEIEVRRGFRLFERLGFSSVKPPDEEPKRSSAEKLIPKDKTLRKCWHDRDAFMTDVELPEIAKAVPEAVADIRETNQKRSVLLERRGLAGSVQAKGVIPGIEKTASSAATTVTAKDVTDSTLPDLKLIESGAKNGLSECRQLLRSSEAILKAVEKDMEIEKRTN